MAMIRTAGKSLTFADLQGAQYESLQPPLLQLKLAKQS
jgi:hypothetical protein